MPPPPGAVGSPEEGGLRKESKGGAQGDRGGGRDADTTRYLSNVRASDSLSNVVTVDKNTGRNQRIEGARDSSD